MRRLHTAQCVLQSGTRRLAQIDWCPTRTAVLAAITTDERLVRVWHLNDFLSNQQQQPPPSQLPAASSSGATAAGGTTALEKSASAGSSAGSSGGSAGGSSGPTAAAEPAALALKPTRVHECAELPLAFAWALRGSSPSLLTVAASGSVEHVRFNETVPLARAAGGALAFALGRALVEAPPLTSASLSPVTVSTVERSLGSAAVLAAIQPQQLLLLTVDISDIMLRRAKMGYSLDASQNVRLMREAVQQKNGMSCSLPLGLASPAPGSVDALLQLWCWLADSRTGRDIGTSSSSSSSASRPPSSSSSPAEAAATAPSGDAATLPGIRSLLSQAAAAASKKLDAGGVAVYTSPARTQCAIMCQWSTRGAQDITKRDGGFDSVVSRLEQEEQFERAAALAVFHGDLQRATKALASAAAREASLAAGGSADLTLRMVAMALAAGSSSQRAAAGGALLADAGAWGAASSSGSGSSSAHHHRVASLWRDTWHQWVQTEPRLHPYVRAAFAFLAATDADETRSSVPFGAVLNDSSLLLSDRVAFACRFLDDQQLLSYVDSTQAALVARGAVEGVLLTGLSSQAAFDLFERYVDFTADIQTAALALYRNPNASRWLHCYRRMLDNWQLWYERAAFDMARGANANSNSGLTPQVYVRCNFCSQSLQLSQLSQRRSAHTHSLLAGRSSSRPVGSSANGSPGAGVAVAFAGPSSSQKVLVTSCPHCKKSLPRCSICLLSMSVQLPTLPLMAAGRADNSAQRFDDWFTWCQSCRHGGHAAHLQLWFQSHEECPVGGCDCPCSSL
eukprot:TRINITY_DN1077_c0_g1_i1.p1 TRINITY_DN1077_c0_g1~~TRINITY_DN1077_c0_g1_i1.p1  ORF type:complete len:793 (+),score=189.99 TRINITY_DN1077_c0_g1_i1:387-2765(+)